MIQDEDDHRSRGSVIEYDPERGSRKYSRSNSAQDKPSTPLRKEAELERTAVLNVSPITSNFQWQAVSDNSASMSSIMPPLAAVPKRGILKSTSSGVRDLPTTFSVMAEDVDDVLYDTNSLKAVPSHRRHFQSSSSSESPSSTQSSRKNSISTDQQ